MNTQQVPDTERDHGQHEGQTQTSLLQDVTHGESFETSQEHSWYTTSPATQDYADRERSQGLSEISAPAPGQQQPFDCALKHDPPDHAQNLEQEENEDLTELAAPAPIEEDSTGKWRKDKDLESRRRRRFASVSEFFFIF